MTARDVDHLCCVTGTGIATPSLDARIVNRLGMRSDVRRTPIFGLGCAGGVAGVVRAADVLRGFPGQVAVVVSAGLCSLTLQRTDDSVANIIATALDLPPGALDRSWRLLAATGNLSSASVLFVLRDLLEARATGPGDHGLMLAMGPGFCAELALLEW